MDKEEVSRHMNEQRGTKHTYTQTQSQKHRHSQILMNKTKNGKKAECIDVQTRL